MKKAPTPVLVSVLFFAIGSSWISYGLYMLQPSLAWIFGGVLFCAIGVVSYEKPDA